MENLTDRVTRGVAWMVVLRLSVRGLGLISTLILVRLLDPADFGIVAMAMVVVAGIEMFASFGFDVALIHKQDSGRAEYDTAWTISAILGFASAAAIALLAYPAARLYDEPRLVLVFQVIAVASILEGLKNIGIVEFRKQLQLQKEFAFQLAVKLSGFVFTIFAAFWFRSYWALVLGILVSRMASLVLSYVMQPYRPTFCLAAMDSIFNYSKWLFINNFLVYLRLRSPDFIIGKVLGVSSLGLYTIAHEISQLPTTELVAPINRVLLPGLATIAKDVTRLKQAFVRAASAIVLLSLPTAFGMASTAHLFTPIALGEKWLAAIPLIRVLSVYGGMIAILSPITTTLLAIGRPSTVALLSAINLAVILPFIYFATTEYGLIGTASTMTVILLLFLPLYYGIAARAIGLGSRDVFGIFGRPTLSTLAMYFIVDYLFGGAVSSVVNLLLAISTGVLAYAGLSALLWMLAGKPQNCGESFLLEQISSRLRRRSNVESRLQ